MNRKFVILNSDEVVNVDFSQVLETSKSTLKYNIEGTRTFVKYEGEQPSFLAGKTEYTHQEILTILAGPEWTSDEE
jgi:hypothetical protein